MQANADLTINPVRPPNPAEVNTEVFSRARRMRSSSTTSFIFLMPLTSAAIVLVASPIAMRMYRNER